MYRTRYFNPGYPGNVEVKESIQKAGGTILSEEILWINVSWPDVRVAHSYDESQTRTSGFKGKARETD